MTVIEQMTEAVVPGPFAFTPVDEMIRDSVESLLRSTEHGSVREVRSLVEDGVVLLFGTVSSYHLKQIVQVEVMKLELVARVENHCKVDRRA